MSESNAKPFPRVADFYDGKSIFITGAAGYLGVLILETLLELCPGVRTVYILVREKRGVSPDKRKDAILHRSVFDKIREEMPQVLDKVQVVRGDISLPNFGMSDEDLQKIVEDASIVFHCAACISFLKPLRFILQTNVASTQYAVDICRKMKTLDALVFTSSTYGNANRKTAILEEIYRLPYHAQRFLDEINNGSDESLERMVNECLPKWPNFYTFSKSLGENVLQDNAADLPVIIVRPSIIASVWKRPLPGYVEETSGITALSAGVGKGFLKCLKGDPDSLFDFITGDLCATTHIVAAWSVATKRSPPLLVLNNSSCVVCPISVYCDIMLQVLFGNNLLPNTFRQPTTFHVIRNPLVYWAYSLYQHYVPAYAFDLILRLKGSKMRLVPIYRMADKASASLAHFMTHSWTFITENYENLIKQLQEEDRKLFELEALKSTGYEIAELLPSGSPAYQWKYDKRSKEERTRIASQRLLLTNVVKAIFLLSVAAVLYFIFTSISALF